MFAVIICFNGNCWFWIIVMWYIFPNIIDFEVHDMIHCFWSLWCVNDVFLFDQQVNQSKGSHYDSMSDSETDDAWRAVLLSRTKLNEVKQRLRNLEEDDQFTKNPVELVIYFFTIFSTIKKKQWHLKKNCIEGYVSWYVQNVCH